MTGDGADNGEEVVAAGHLRCTKLSVWEKCIDDSDSQVSVDTCIQKNWK